MDNRARDNKVERPYRKPKITQVKLMPEQAVLAGCQISGGDTQLDMNCRKPPVNCQY